MKTLFVMIAVLLFLTLAAAVIASLLLQAVFEFFVEGIASFGDRSFPLI